MPSTTDVDPELLRIGRGIERLRTRLGLTQAEAAAGVHPDNPNQKGMSSQYWGMHETGRVPGLHKPAFKRRLLEALSHAAELQTPLTLDDLDAAMQEDGQGGDAAPGDRLARMARELRGSAPAPDTRRAVFPIAEGDVVIEIPASLTPEGFAQVEAYLAVFLKANAPKA